jgi:hypothetical protein
MRFLVTIGGRTIRSYLTLEQDTYHWTSHPDYAGRFTLFEAIKLAYIYRKKFGTRARIERAK